MKKEHSNPQNSTVLRQELPYIALDESAEVLYFRRIPSLEYVQNLLDAMLPGDRCLLTEFCAKLLDESESGFRLFRLQDFPPYEYLFLEKNLLRGKQVNIVYVGIEISDFALLMSPTSQHFRDVSAKILYEILSMRDQKTADVPYLTPAAFLTLDQMPHLREELLRNPRCPGYCDLVKMTSLLLVTVRSQPTFRSTEILFDPPADADANTIYEFSVPSYVYLLCSLLQIFYALSADHRIHIALDDDGNLLFSLYIHPCRMPDGEITDFSQLGRIAPSMMSVAKIAAFVAADAKISAVMRYDTVSHEFRTVLGICGEPSIPQFHYRDPYADLPAMAAEFCDFLTALIGAA